MQILAVSKTQAPSLNYVGRDGRELVNLAERLADYAFRLSYSDLDSSTIDEAKKRFVDAFGCAIGSYDEAPVKIARRVASSTGNGKSTILGTRTKVPTEAATFVNGLMIRYFDFNDTYLSKEPAHPSDNVGATLSVAEREGANGKDLILSTVLAYEIQCRLCDAADIRHRGWDHVCYGLVSAALGAGKLLGLGRDQLANAVNIALSAHIAMRQVRAGEISMWKGASFAEAARNAVFAAFLAEAGMKGPSPIFEGEMGFFRQVSGPFELDFESFGGRGGSFKLKESCVKYWPVEYHAQTAVWAAAQLKKEFDDPADIESILVETHEAGYSILGKDREKWRPSTKETADHSLPYIVAVSLLRGKIENSDYSPTKLQDPEMLKVIKKVRTVEDPKLTKLYPNRGMPNKITVNLRGGKTATAESTIPRGHPLNPMDESELESKFRNLAGKFLGRRRTEEALLGLRSLERVKDTGEIMSLLRISERH